MVRTASAAAAASSAGPAAAATSAAAAAETAAAKRLHQYRQYKYTRLLYLYLKGLHISLYGKAIIFLCHSARKRSV